MDIILGRRGGDVRPAMRGFLGRGSTRHHKCGMASHWTRHDLEQRGRPRCHRRRRPQAETGAQPATSSCGLARPPHRTHTVAELHTTGPLPPPPRTSASFVMSHTTGRKLMGATPMPCICRCSSSSRSLRRATATTRMPGGGGRRGWLRSGSPPPNGMHAQGADAARCGCGTGAVRRREDQRDTGEGRGGCPSQALLVKLPRQRQGLHGG